MSKVFFVLTGIILSYSVHGQQTVSRDSAFAAASKQYANPSFFKRVVLGNNYRREWSQPVKLPVFHLKRQGFKIEELGGGQQTKSLQLTDPSGRNWVLRTVEKDVEKALPEKLRNTVAEKVTQELISASHPYGAVTIPPINKALGVTAPEPVVYFVPDDPDFGEFRTLFANTVCLLEQRDPTPDRSKTINSDDLLEKILDENDHRVDQSTVLKARLVDMLIADWDRHSDQWRWGKTETKDLDLYFAVPRDRDQAFFHSDGLLVKFTRHFAMKHLVGFRDNLTKLKHLNFKAWKFDGLFLNELDRQDWDSTIRWVQAQLTDDLIHKAMTQMPPEVYAIRGQNLEKRFRGRRDELHKKGMQYYRFIAKKIMINGSDKEELFRVSERGQHLLVQVYDIKDGKAGDRIYERVFDQGDTWRITLNGYGGSDRFEVGPGISSKIRLQLAGGDGNDLYDIQGARKNTILEKVPEDNQFKNKHRTRIKTI